MKYMGSKNRVAKHIVPILEDSFKDNNCEVFMKEVEKKTNVF